MMSDPRDSLTTVNETLEAYCWICGNTGEVREQPIDDLSGYIPCDCTYGICGCGCSEPDDGWADR